MSRIAPLVATALALAAGRASGQDTPFQRVSYELPRPALQMIVATLDADETLDVVALTSLDDVTLSLSILRGARSGRFELASDEIVTTATLPGLSRMAVGDVNGDGRLDVLISNAPEQTCLATSEYRFECAGDLPTAGGIQHDVMLADYDGDGDLDSVLLVDDLDMYLDVGENSGDGRFETPSFVFGNAPNLTHYNARCLLADLRGDGRLTAIGTDSWLGLSAMTWGSALSFGSGEQLIAGKVLDATIGDIDADGLLDVVVAAPDEASIGIVLSDPAGGFAGVRKIPALIDPTRVALGEVTGDEHLDVLVASEGGLVILAGDGNGNFEPWQRIENLDFPVDIETADGDLDVLLLVNELGKGRSRLDVFLNQVRP